MAVAWPLVWQHVTADPLVTYSLAATMVLAIVSWSSGLGRVDLAALAHPRVLLRVSGAVAVSFLLTTAARTLAPEVEPRALAIALEGLGLVPLYLVTLAYGPSIGVIAAVLSAGFAADAAFPGWREAILALELVALGWLAIYPSPRQARWAGPLDVALAHALAWGTGGVAWLALRGGGFAPAAWRTEVAAGVLPVAVAALVVGAFGPAFYRSAFPGSRIAPGRAARDDAASFGNAAGLGNAAGPGHATALGTDAALPTAADTTFPDARWALLPALGPLGAQRSEPHPTRPRHGPLTPPAQAKESIDAGRTRAEKQAPAGPPLRNAVPTPFATKRARRTRRLMPLPPLDDDPSR